MGACQGMQQGSHCKVASPVWIWVRGSLFDIGMRLSGTLQFSAWACSSHPHSSDKFPPQFWPRFDGLF